MSIATIKWTEQNIINSKKERDKNLKEKLRRRQVKQDLRLHVIQHAQQIYQELRISFFFHYFITCKEKDLKDLTRQFTNFQKFNKLVKNMNEEKLKKTENELKILEEEIKKLKQKEKFKPDIKYKRVSLKIPKKKNLNPKKGIIKNHGPFDQITNATPRLKIKNKLLNMATG